MDDDFTAIKQIKKLTLHAQPSQAPTSLSTHTYPSAIGAVIYQLIKKWLLITFFSKQLPPAMEKYRIFDMEPLNIYAAI